MLVSEKYARQKKYNDENTKLFTIRLNFKTDEDIISNFEGKKVQTEIKRLIRLGLEYEKLQQVKE